MKIRNISKKVSVFLASLLVLVGLTACNNSKSLPDNANLAGLAEQIVTKIEFEDKDLAPLDDRIKASYLNQVDFSKVENSVVYAGGGFIAEEIALFEAKGEDESSAKEAADAIEKSINERFEYFRTSYGDYSPEQLQNLENPVLIKEGKYVFSVISAENSEAENIIKTWIKDNSK